jgi:hypothetical protein
MTESILSRAQWHKSSYSSANAQCVEVASAGGAVALRDSKHAGGPHLVIAATAWRAFVSAVKDGDLAL